MQQFMVRTPRTENYLFFKKFSHNQNQIKRDSFWNRNSKILRISSVKYRGLNNQNRVFGRFLDVILQ